MRFPAFMILASLTTVTTEAMVGSDALEGQEVQPFASITTLLGRHCPQGHPQRVSQLFSVALDLMAT